MANKTDLLPNPDKSGKRILQTLLEKIVTKRARKKGKAPLFILK